MTGSSGIAFAQSSTQNDSTKVKCSEFIHYTDKQDKRCLECLINEPKKDSIIYQQSLMVLDYEKELERMYDVNKDLKRKNKKAWIFGGISGIIVTSAIALLVGLSTK